VAAGSELSFDYQWPRSSRPPTKCHCLTPTCRGYLEVGLDANSLKKKKDKDKNRYGGDDITFNSSNNGRKLTVERYNDEYRYGRRRGVWKTHTEIPYVHVESTNITSSDTENDNKNLIKNENIKEKEKEKENENKDVIYFKDENSDDKNIENKIENTEIKTETELLSDIKIENKVKKEVDITTTSSYRQFLSQWLVGKYVRVWWLENMRFFEAEVGDFNSKKGQFP
jgi:hypothetical protein